MLPSRALRAANVMCNPLPPFPSPLWAPISENNGPVWDWNVSGNFAKRDTLNLLWARSTREQTLFMTSAQCDLLIPAQQSFWGKLLGDLCSGGLALIACVR